MDNKMDEQLFLEHSERNLRNEMSAEEKVHFENMRKNNADADLTVVENSFFLNELNKYCVNKNFKATLNEVDTQLTQDGIIKNKSLQGKAKVIYLWKKYKRTAAVAASIAGIVSLFTVAASSIVNNNKANKEYTQLSNDVKSLKEGIKANAKELHEVKTVIDPKATFKSGGTGFLIDSKGYLITNAHVLKGKTIVATNSKGQQYLAKLCMKDATRDIAVLKIDDKDFKAIGALPYGFKNSVILAEPVFTLGYPKDEIVYNEGYLSSETGYKSDTLSYQISVSADHGNSGGPILNKNGDVIGILSDKAEGGAVFAVKSMYIFKAVENLKKDSAFANIKLLNSNAIKNLNREQQVKRVNNCVFLIKSYD